MEFTINTTHSLSIEANTSNHVADNAIENHEMFFGGTTAIFRR